MPGHQKKGVGGMLVRELEKRFSNMGLRVVAVQVDKGNRRSLRFFRGCGFRLHDDIHYLSKRKGHWA
jgi:ribosomal protein S18 acetylase RimI-like enzyme